jgi:hypothetical protein
MQRLSFLKAGGAMTLTAGLGSKRVFAHTLPHNFDNYD